MNSFQQHDRSAAEAAPDARLAGRGVFGNRFIQLVRRRGSVGSL
jgi:hypothetical protein